MDLGQGRAEGTATSFALGGGSSLPVRNVNWNDVMLGLWKGTYWVRIRVRLCTGGELSGMCI